MHVKSLSKEIPFSFDENLVSFGRNYFFFLKGIKHRFGELF